MRGRWIAAVALLLCSTVNAAPPVRLTTDGRAKQWPIFTKSGQQIVYTDERKYNQLMLMRVTLEDGRTSPEKTNESRSEDSAVTRAGVPEPLHPAATTSEFSADWSTDGQVGAYIRNDGNLHVRVVIEDARTGSRIEYDPGGGFAGVQSLSVAPDGSRVFFAFPERGIAQQIFSLTPDGKQKQAVVSSDGFDTCPRISPDGTKLAFASTRDGNFDIFVASLDGASVQRITEHPGLDTHPCWSPDGRRLAYMSLRDGNFDIYVASLAGEPERRLTDDAERDDYPAWHPDGRRLVTVSERGGRQDLYLWTLDK